MCSDGQMVNNKRPVMLVYFKCGLFKFHSNEAVMYFLVYYYFGKISFAMVPFAVFKFLICLIPTAMAVPFTLQRFRVSFRCVRTMN